MDAQVRILLGEPKEYKMGLRLSVRLAPGVWLSKGLGGRREPRKIVQKPASEPGRRRLTALARKHRFDPVKAWEMDVAGLYVVKSGPKTTGIVQFKGDGEFRSISVGLLQKVYNLEPVEVFLLLEGFGRMVKAGYLDQPLRITTALELREELGEC